MHRRISLHQVAFLHETTAAFLGFAREIGLSQVTLVTPSLFQAGETERALEAIRASGQKPLHVACVNHPFAVHPDLETDRGEAASTLLRAIEVAGQLGAPAIYLLTGGRGALDWETAANRFAALLAPCREAAEAKGVRLLVETASPLNVDIHIAHTLDDTLRLAQIAGIGVCLELHACWHEAALAEKFARVLPLTGLVQVSDYVAGDRTTPCRAVPGDGMIPLERLIGMLLDLGYEGAFDLELVGPRITAEGAREASERSAEYLSELLTKLGA